MKNAFIGVDVAFAKKKRLPVSVCWWQDGRRRAAEAARYTGWPSGRPADTRFKDIGFGPAHDRLDACLSAWVAALPEAERIPFGDPPNDVIWTPRLGMAAYERPIVHEAAGARTARRPKAAISQTEQSRLCPACNLHYFKRWPSGWDAHAAHRCQGLSSDGIEERKREFKSRFGDLFPGA